MNTDRIRLRSKLFVPGNRPALFIKALRSEADAVCFDLEDSVLPEHKCNARSHVRSFLQANRGNRQALAVRVNSVRSAYFAEDISWIVSPALRMVNIPKVESPSEIEEASALLAKFEQARGIESPIRILATIESPRGLRLSEAIASADPRVAGLQLGLVDLFGPLGISAKDIFAAQQIRLRLRLAAGEAGLPCFDSAYPNFKDEEGFAAEATSARDLGFSGKSCIHPSQIAVANRIFSPSVEELAEALRIVEAAREAAAAGLGVCVVDGCMIDEPILRRAKELVRWSAELRAERTGSP